MATQEHSRPQRREGEPDPGPDEAPGATFDFAGGTVRKLSELATAMGERLYAAA